MTAPLRTINEALVAWRSLEWAVFMDVVRWCRGRGLRVSIDDIQQIETRLRDEFRRVLEGVRQQEGGR